MCLELSEKKTLANGNGKKEDLLQYSSFFFLNGAIANSKVIGVSSRAGWGTRPNGKTSSRGRLLISMLHYFDGILCDGRTNSK